VSKSETRSMNEFKATVGMHRKHCVEYKKYASAAKLDIGQFLN